MTHKEIIETINVLTQVVSVNSDQGMGTNDISNSTKDDANKKITDLITLINKT